jgi:hypothetical protein
MQGVMDDEAGDKAFFSSRGQGSGSGQKNLTPKEKKKRAARIAELKKKTRCNKCGKKGHWSGNVLTGRKSQAQRDRTKLPHQSQL